MILDRLSLENFRVFKNLDTRFQNGINLITGMNGQGKTSILEAIYYLALTKSFRSNSDAQVINLTASSFDVTGTFTSPDIPRSEIRVYFSKTEGKHLFLNKKKVTAFSQFLGKVPCVVLTLDDLKLTFGNPAERRRFLDILLSQVSPTYLENLKIYRKAMQQRNALLTGDDINYARDNVEIWDEQIAASGSVIIKKREECITFFNQYLPEVYCTFSRGSELIEAKYKSSVSETTSELKAFFRYDFERKTTTTGPHRDDVEFSKDKKLFKNYASQGENKTLIIALKFIEWQYVSQNRNLKPVLLLDDIFGELDEYRMDGLLKFLDKNGQTFITTTLENKFDPSILAATYIVKDHKVYHA
jgi:DNA replication and repair protein RecF